MSNNEAPNSFNIHSSNPFTRDSNNTVEYYKLYSLVLEAWYAGSDRMPSDPPIGYTEWAASNNGHPLFVPQTRNHATDAPHTGNTSRFVNSGNPEDVSYEKSLIRQAATMQLFGNHPNNRKESSNRRNYRTATYKYRPHGPPRRNYYGKQWNNPKRKNKDHARRAIDHEDVNNHHAETNTDEPMSDTA
jgi:hypothetical protein